MNDLFRPDGYFAREMRRLDIELNDPGRTHIVFIIVDDQDLRGEAANALAEQLGEETYELYEFDYLARAQEEHDPRYISPLSLPRFVRGLQREPPPCVFAYNLHWLKLDPQRRQQYDDALTFLNNHREDISYTKRCVVLWLTTDSYRDVATNALDFSDFNTQTVHLKPPDDLVWKSTKLGKLSVEDAQKFRRQLQLVQHNLARPKMRDDLRRDFERQEGDLLRKLGLARDFDVFLAHAPADAQGAKELAQRLSRENVNVWLDADQIQPGEGRRDYFRRQAYQESRKVLALWSDAYFQDAQQLKLAAATLKQEPGYLQQERPYIAVWQQPCDIPADFRKISDTYAPLLVYNLQDDALRWRELLAALNWPCAESCPPGVKFADAVAELYEQLGFATERNIAESDFQLDLLIRRDLPGFRVRAVVECRDTRLTATEAEQILTRKRVIQPHKHYPWVAVTAAGYAPDALTALRTGGVQCFTYSELRGYLKRQALFVPPLGGLFSNTVKQAA